MKVCVIAPTPHLDLSLLGGMHFLLAHRVLGDDIYRTFYAKQTDTFKILDNGAFEKGVPMSHDEILEAADMVGADEVVASDHPGHSRKSLKATMNFLSVCPKHLRVMAVPHGKTWKEYQRSLEKLTMSEARTIGFSILTLWKFEHRIRPIFLNAVNELGLLDHRQQYHLLGLDCPAELHSYTTMMIRSVDTSLPISLARSQRRLTYYFKEPEAARARDDEVLIPEKLALARRNITALLGIAGTV